MPKIGKDVLGKGKGGVIQTKKDAEDYEEYKRQKAEEEEEEEKRKKKQKKKVIKSKMPEDRQPSADDELRAQAKLEAEAKGKTVHVCEHHRHPPGEAVKSEEDEEED